jgi:hypothetical protein
MGLFLDALNAVLLEKIVSSRQNSKWRLCSRWRQKFLYFSSNTQPNTIFSFEKNHRFLHDFGALSPNPFLDFFEITLNESSFGFAMRLQEVFYENQSIRGLFRFESWSFLNLLDNFSFKMMLLNSKKTFQNM